MPITISEYIDVKAQALKLGCNVPAELALLPINFDTADSKDELVHEDAVLTVRKLWRQAGITETKLEKEGEKFSYEQRKSFEWVPPIIFVSASVLSQNPDLVSIALNVISTYLTDYFKGIVGDKTVKFDIIVEQNKSKRIHYEGSLEGLDELTQVIKEIKNL
jgi:tagatose-1,6-bisphosphate aldolase non-catalytic subunit AgaZ/GatZ